LFGIESCSKAFLATSVGIVTDDLANGTLFLASSSRLAYLDWELQYL
jgi:hypothetical protein